jgi:hypothetical protein
MLRIATRGFVIVLALLFVVASAGTILCEMNCVAGEPGASAAGMTDGSKNIATSHCDGEQPEAMQLDMPAPHGNPGGNTKHGNAHSHLRIVAKVTAESQLSPALTPSDFASAPANFRGAIISRNEENLWNNNPSPPINFPSVFSADVLRI